jgi:type VI secretion system secreted protein VgrG
LARTTYAAFGIQDATAYSVLRVREVHALNAPVYADVDVLFPGYVDTETFIAQTAEVVYGYDDGTTRTFAGLVESVTVVGSSAAGGGGRTYQYSFHLVTQVSMLAGNHGCRILQKVDVKDAVTAVLTDTAPDLTVEWRLKGSYPKRDYCVQYQETDLAFVSRLVEGDGIHYFFEAGDDGTLKLIFSDDSTSAAPITGDSTLHQKTGGIESQGDAIIEFSEGGAVVSGKFVLRDYNFKTPKLDMTATAAGNSHTDFEVYDYPGGYLDPGDGNRLAKLRLEAEQTPSKTLSLRTNCMRIGVGRKLTVADAESADGDWLVTSVVHEYEGEVEDAGGRQGQKARVGHVASVELIPAAVPFRPARVTPRPYIEGPQTAEVVCPSGSQPEEIHTDEHGQCKVQFHWDLVGKHDDKATAWMRVSQLQTSGSMMLPRIGWEVLVEFLEGDPDRPIVTGRLYNGAYMPPYALPGGKTRTSIGTASTPGGGGSNEIRFEDKAGGEEIMLHSQKDTNVAVANNKTKNVGNNETLNVGADSKTTIGANHTVKITKGSQSSITANQTVTVGATRELEVNAVAAWNVAGNSTTVVGGMQSEQIGNPLQALIALAVAKAAEIAAAKAKDAVAAVQGAVQGKIDQALGPVKDLASKVDGLNSGLNALGNGDLSALGGVVAGATKLPGAGAMAAAMSGGGGQGGGGGSGGGGGGSGDGGSGGPTASGEVGQVGDKASALATAAGNMADSALTNAIQNAASKAVAGLDDAAGVDGGGGGGDSAENADGPVGDVDGVDATDRAKGPGHSLYKVGGNHSEKVGAIKVLGALSGINNNVGGDAKVSAGAAIIQMSYGDTAEDVTGSKTESELGLIVMSKGETETVGSKTQMIGGAIIDKVAGNQGLESDANVMIIGALHKWEAGESISISCGESSVVIDSNGITITAAASCTMTTAKAQFAKPATVGP